LLSVLKNGKCFFERAHFFLCLDPELGSSKNFNSYELTASPHFIFNTGVKETDF
jgi:hypothetical protein